LWLSSGAVTTGFHTDGPDNLLVQLSGRKDVLLSRPSEQKNLYYLPAFDVQAGMRLENGTVRSSGVRKANRTSSGHSVVDLANPETAARFPRYSRASSLRCRIKAGDVLFIPSFWHHAVATAPDESCAGLSLNLWYQNEGGKMMNHQDAIAKWGGSRSDLEVGPRDWA